MKKIIFIVISCLTISSFGCSSIKIPQDSAVVSKEQNKEIDKRSTENSNITKEIQNIDSLDSNLCKKDEEVVFGFKTYNSDKRVSVCVSSKNDYIVYRYGTKDKIEMEYPNDKVGSWDKFSFDYYTRGGGAVNEGLDLSYLSFDNDNFNYKIYEEYSAVGDNLCLGLIVLDKTSNEETDIKGIEASRVGSLTYFRDSKVKIKQNQVRDEDQEKDNLEIGFELMQSESLGFLKFGMSKDQVIEKMGEPDEKSDLVTWGADGLNHQSWFYRESGIELDMAEYNRDLAVNMIRITSLCNLKTIRGIGIGSVIDDVLEKYKNEINEDETAMDTSSLVAGTVYGGMIFRFDNDKVSSIFLGAAAE